MERVGVVPEEPDAPPAMTATQLSEFCRRIYPRWDSAAVSARLERFGVPAGVPFGRLSKGQRGEVMLALALGHAPALLVLDDPTLGLDVVARHALFEEIVGELADRGTTVFLTTHDLSGFEGIASRVGILKEGRLVLDEELEALKSRFRRIRYANRLTETRTQFGNELDEFDALRVRVRGWGIDAVVTNFADAAFERFRATDGVEDASVEAMPLEEIFLAVAGEEKEKRHMRGFLAVARREVAQRRILFVGAVFAAAIPFAVPLLRGLRGTAAIESRSATALAFSVAFLYGVSAFLGGTVLPRGISERRIGFDFARPLSTWAIWGGTLLGTIVLATGSALIAWGPAALVGDAASWPNLVDSLEIPLPWPVLMMCVSLLLFAIFQTAGTALRSRSVLLLVDLLLVAVAVAAATNGLVRLLWAGAGADMGLRAAVVLGLIGLFALLLASYASVARGRTSIRAAHGAQSLVFWTTVGAGILGLYGYGWWLSSAPPSEMTKIQTVRPAARGSWVLVDGVARGAEATFLYDTGDRRFTRVPWGVGEPTFSEDGRIAGWIQKLGKSTRLRIVDLAKKRPSPETRATLSNEAAGLVFDAAGSRVAVIEKEGLSVYDVHTGRLLVAARIAAYLSFPRAFFVGPERLRIYWFPSAAENTRLDILELDVPGRRLVRTGIDCRPRRMAAACHRPRGTATGLRGVPIEADSTFRCSDGSAHRLAARARELHGGLSFPVRWANRRAQPARFGTAPQGFFVRGLTSEGVRAPE